MGELVEWLRAQLDEDERIACGTGQPSTSWQGVDMDGELRDDLNAGTVAYVPREETRAHIARHDPARVLRETDAKRQVIAKYTKAVERMAELGSLIERLKADGRDTLMPEMDRATAIHRRDVLAEVLRLLALPYADRPGYRDDWRP